MATKTQRWLFVLAGMILGGALAAWWIQRDERLRQELEERARKLREQAIELQTVTLGKAQQASEQALERAAQLQAEVSAEVERRLSEGRETLDAMLERVRAELQELQARAQKLAHDAQIQAQLARKKAELRALEARKRLRELRG